MQNSRDSSVWRSLAVAFGDGLAFGVGMKLTQSANRATPTEASADLTPLEQRLEQMERRLAEMEQQPRALMAPAKEAPQPHPFDQKVLEAVINALDARLREHSGQVERQITELQAKVTIELQTLHQQDRSIADGLQAHIREMEKHFTEQVGAIHQAWEDSRHAIQEQFATLRREAGVLVASQLETRAAELQEQMAGQFHAIRTAADFDRRSTQEQFAALRQESAESAETDRQNVQAQIAALEHGVADVIATQFQSLQGQLRDEVRQAVSTAAEEHSAPLRTAMEAKDREIAELRARLTGSEQATLDLLQGVGEICRKAASRITGSEPGDPPAGSSAEPPAGEPAQEPGDAPGFTQSKTPSRLWRVPLVSSVVFTTGALMIRHALIG